MLRKIVFLVLALAFGAPALADTTSPICTEVPDSFHEWRLLDIHDDEVKVSRWFRHPIDASCHGISVALLLDCKEYPIVRSVFTLGENDVALESRTLLRGEDDQWRTGSGVNFRRDVAGGKRVAIFVLNSPDPFRREVTLTEPCEQRW